MRRFPFPLSTNSVTVYGRSTCPYCQKMKEIVDNINKSREKINIYKKQFKDPSKLTINKAKYYDIEELIKNNYAKDYNDFRSKLEIFIGDYPTVPLVFIDGIFIGGYDDFVDISKEKARFVKKELLKNEYKNNKKAENILKVEIKHIYDKNKEKLEKEIEKLSKRKD